MVKETNEEVETEISRGSGGGKRVVDHEDNVWPTDSQERVKRMKATMAVAIAVDEKITAEDCMGLIMSYLPFTGLITLRGTSKVMKKMVHKILLDRMQEHPPKAMKIDLKLHFVRSGGDDRNRIRVHQGWTKDFEDLEQTIECAINTGKLTWYTNEDDRKFYTEFLQEHGSIGDDEFDEEDQGGEMLSWRREVEWNDNLAISSAIEKVGKFFHVVEGKHKNKFRGRYVFDRTDEDVNNERNEQSERIRMAKESCMLLLLMNASDTVSISWIKCKDLEQPSWNEDDSTVLVFRFDNGMEARLDSSRVVNSEYGDY